MCQMIGPNNKPWSMGGVLACVGAGWERLVTQLVEDLFALGWDGTLLQIKEKFGGLRFYIGESTDAIAARIAAAEEESYRTCDLCGAPGVLRRGRWLVVRCGECDESP